MKKFFYVLFLAVIAGGAIWYETRPQTITIPVETEDSYYVDDYLDEPATTQAEITIAEAPREDIDYSKPDLTLQIRGVNGDEINLREVIGEPQHLGDLDVDVQNMVTSCPGVTDRDMVVRVDAQLELLSSLPAEVSVDYGTGGHASVYRFSDGLSCDGNSVNHKLAPDKKGHIAYWVVLTGVITPDHPDGDFQNTSAVITSPNLTLPNFEKMYFKLWGPRVVTCNTILGDSSKVWLAGNWKDDGCELATTEALAVGNM